MFLLEYQPFAMAWQIRGVPEIGFPIITTTKIHASRNCDDAFKINTHWHLPRRIIQVRQLPA